MINPNELSTLRLRLARGEISEAEFDRLLARLGGSDAPGQDTDSLTTVARIRKNCIRIHLLSFLAVGIMGSYQLLWFGELVTATENGRYATLVENAENSSAEADQIAAFSRSVDAFTSLSPEDRKAREAGWLEGFGIESPFPIPRPWPRLDSLIGMEYGSLMSQDESYAQEQVVRDLTLSSSVIISILYWLVSVQLIRGLLMLLFVVIPMGMQGFLELVRERRQNDALNQACLRRSLLTKPVEMSFYTLMWRNSLKVEGTTGSIGGPLAKIRFLPGVVLAALTVFGIPMLLTKVALHFVSIP
jgi:hypothetical protein